MNGWALGIAVLVISALPQNNEVSGQGVRSQVSDELYFRGRVLDARTNRPLGGADVRIVALGTHAAADSDGFFTLRVTPAEGHTSIEANVTGYYPIWQVMSTACDRQVRVAREAVVCERRIDFHLRPVTDLRQPKGERCSLAGTVLTSGEESAANVMVELRGTKLGRLTDQKGGFVLSDVPAGLYSLAISHIGYAPQETMMIVACDGTGMSEAHTFWMTPDPVVLH